MSEWLIVGLAGLVACATSVAIGLLEAALRRQNPGPMKGPLGEVLYLRRWGYQPTSSGSGGKNPPPGESGKKVPVVNVHVSSFDAEWWRKHGEEVKRAIGKAPRRARASAR